MTCQLCPKPAAIYYTWKRPYQSLCWHCFYWRFEFDRNTDRYHDAERRYIIANREANNDEAIQQKEMDAGAANRLDAGTRLEPPTLAGEVEAQNGR